MIAVKMVFVRFFGGGEQMWGHAPDIYAVDW